MYTKTNGIFSVALHKVLMDKQAQKRRHASVVRTLIHFEWWQLRLAQRGVEGTLELMERLVVPVQRRAKRYALAMGNDWT